MTENQEKTTPSKIIKNQEELKTKYEEDSKEKDQQILDLQNTVIDKDNEIFELQKANKRLEGERDDWKTEANARSKVHQESKQVKEKNDFLSEFKNLQAQKGRVYEEGRGWVITK